MTDGRFPERWLNDRRFSRMSDAAFRLFVVANTWAASNRTDGEITRDDLTLFPGYIATDRVHELVAAGFWIEDGDRWLIAGYANTQTTAAQLDAAEHARAMARQRQAAKRLRDAGTEPIVADQEDVTRDVTRDDIGQARPGQDRKYLATPENTNDHAGSNFGSIADADLVAAFWADKDTS